MMAIISKYTSVFLIGILELWGAIPVGLALKLNPLYVSILSSAGAITSVFLVLIIGEPVSKWILKFKKPNVGNENAKHNRAWEKFGIPGLCLISPLVLGAHAGTAIGLTFGGKKCVIAVWMTISCLVWSGILTSLATMGISLFHQ